MCCRRDDEVKEVKKLICSSDDSTKVSEGCESMKQMPRKSRVCYPLTSPPTACLWPPVLTALAAFRAIYLFTRDRFRLPLIHHPGCPNICLTIVHPIKFILAVLLSFEWDPQTAIPHPSYAGVWVTWKRRSNTRIYLYPNRSIVRAFRVYTHRGRRDTRCTHPSNWMRFSTNIGFLCVT
jgi:hypothetical protein